MSRDVKGCQGMSRDVKGCQGMSRDVCVAKKALVKLFSSSQQPRASQILVYHQTRSTVALHAIRK